MEDESVTGLVETEIKQAVRRRYAELAVMNEGCCNTAVESGDVPKESLVSAASCGSPVANASLTEGEVVLDLGSGGGIDVFRAAKLIGPSGRAIGVDSTPEMIFKAREVAKKYDYNNVEFRLGEIEHLPVESGSVDVVISNCVLNLVPEKELAFGEIYRVLKPNGRIAVSDMVATENLKREISNAEDWAACIAGAIPMDEYEQLLRKSGFRNIRHSDESSSFNETCCAQGIPVKSVAWSATKPSA